MELDGRARRERGRQQRENERERKEREGERCLLQATKQDS
jgi:hypothetical protein